MALDVYVGPLSTYYSGQWENTAQRRAREAGAEYRMIRTKKVDDAVMDPVAIRPAIAGWRKLLSEALGSNLAEPLDWDEASPDYWTARPNHDGLSALVLWAAYADCTDLVRPLELPAAIEDDPALLRLQGPDAETRFSHLVRRVEFWLPGHFTFTFKADAPHGEALMFGSTRALLLQLQELNAATWQADDKMLEAWGIAAPPPGAPLQQVARYAFSDMIGCARMAVEHHLPMKLDY